MYDLIYAGADLERLIKDKYPNAKLTDASDFIHTERFECEIDGAEEDEFYIFAIREGFVKCCLGFQLRMRGLKPESHQQVWDWLAEARALNESEKVGA